MLSRQVAPLLRKFCKVSAYFTIASQRGHALTMLRSFKVILNFSIHATWPTQTCSKLPARQQYHQFNDHKWRTGKSQDVFGRRHLPQLCSASAAGAVSSGSPDFSFASILTRSSGSGLRSRAWDHWKRLEQASNPPIGIAEVIVDGRILGLELDGALELLDRLVHVAEPVICPAEGVDDVTVVGALLDRAFDHTHALVEIDA